MKRIIFLLIYLNFISVSALFGANIISPEEFLGYRVGADYKIARWDKIVEYFKRIDEASDWIQVIELGKSTLGNPFIMAVITTPENMKQLEKYRGIAKKLADPRTLSAEEARKLSQEGKAIVLITQNIHSTEIASVQASMELAYNLISGKEKRAKKALSDVILLLIPSVNPDGEIMVVDWYYKWLGTEYEGSPMPWLYHHYAGHDNNRDWFMFNLVETQLVSKVYYHTWFPQVILDQHQMGYNGARMFVPPVFDPPNPNVHPLIWRELALIGAHMAQDLEEAGKSGVIDRAYFTGWWEGASIQTPWWHNIVGVLTEVASVNIASPVYVDPNELSGSELGLPEYRQSINFPNPWKGGIWRLRDIIDYELIACNSLIETVANYKEDFLYNFYIMNKDAIEKGKNEPPFAFLIPPNQLDKITLAKMIEILMFGGVEVHKSTEKFYADGREFPEGTYIIYLAQPNGRYAKDLLEIQKYPNIRRYPEGPPLSPYDTTGWTLGLQMGIDFYQIDNSFIAKSIKLEKPEYPTGKIDKEASYVYLLEDSSNNSFKAINLLLKNNYNIYRAKEDFKMNNKEYKAGTFIIQAKKNEGERIKTVATRYNLEFYGANEKPVVNVLKINKPRIGLYKPWIASMDEGWTRFVLEKYEFDYTNLTNKDIKNEALKDKYDAIIIPDIQESIIVEGKPPEDMRIYYRPMPPEYTGGIGKEGVDNLKKFAENGGTILFFDSSSQLALKHFDIPVKNALEKYKNHEFYCPGSFLRVKINNSHPIGYGMPETAAIFFYSSMAFQTYIPFGKFDRTVIASYPDDNILLSGWLLGEDKLAKKVALLDLKISKGHLIFYGFRVQHRAQTYGTFKLLFNGLYYSSSINDKLP